MITLITGVPGAGKTARLVDELFFLVETQPDRAVFVSGVPDLIVPHEMLPEDAAKWTKRDDTGGIHFDFPVKSIVVIDEAQRYYRPRPVGSKVPDNVAAFETHRHLGLDFFLVTQHPNLLDANIRRLVGRHLHVHVHPFGRSLLEWAGARNPDDKTDRGDAVSKPYKPPKRVFHAYRSAEVHTKVRRGFPKALVFVLVALLLAAALGTYAVKRIAGKSDTVTLQTGSKATEKVVAPVVGQPVPAGFVPSGSDPFKPTDPNRPESAPAYAQLAQVRNLPVIVGCVATSDLCRCYTQQGTDAQVPQDSCRSRLKSWSFDAYRDFQATENVQQRPTQSPGAVAAPAPVVVAAKP